MNLLVNIDVPDLDGGVRFYTSAFDLSVGRRLGTDVVELVGGSCAIYLLRKPPDTKAVPGSELRRHYDRHWTAVHLDVVVADIDAAVRRAVTAGARLEEPVQSSNWGKLAPMSDPYGHGFCLIQFVGRGYDEIATGEATGAQAGARSGAQSGAQPGVQAGAQAGVASG